MTDAYRGMSPNDAARAAQHAADGVRIQRARERAARLLLAPPGPAQEVKDNWAPLSKRSDAGRVPGPPDLSHTIGPGIGYDTDAAPYVTPAAGLPGAGVDHDEDLAPYLTDGE